MKKPSERRHKERIWFAVLDFFKRDFEVSDAEISKILNVQTEVVQGWFLKRRVNLSIDKNLEMRIILLHGIHWNLCAMFSESKNRIAWLKTPHPEMYNKRSPLESISRPGGLSPVNSYTGWLVSQGA